MRSIIALSLLSLLSLAGCGPAPSSVEHLFDWRPDLHVQDGPLGVRLGRFACLPRTPGFMQGLRDAPAGSSSGPGVAFVLELDIQVEGKPWNSGGLVDSGGPYEIRINGALPVPVGGSVGSLSEIADEGIDGRIVVLDCFYEAPRVGDTLDVEVFITPAGDDSRSIRFADLAVPFAARVTR